MKSLWEFLEVSWRGESQQNHYVYEFVPFQLDATRRVLLKEGEPLRRFPKEFDTLMALVKGFGELLMKDDLIRQVWAPNYTGLSAGVAAGAISIGRPMASFSTVRSSERVRPFRRWTRTVAANNS